MIHARKIQCIMTSQHFCYQCNLTVETLETIKNLPSPISSSCFPVQYLPLSSIFSLHSLLSSLMFLLLCIFPIRSRFYQATFRLVSGSSLKAHSSHCNLSLLVSTYYSYSIVVFMNTLTFLPCPILLWDTLQRTSLRSNVLLNCTIYYGLDSLRMEAETHENHWA